MSSPDPRQTSREPTVAATIYDELRRLIVRGRLMPGTRLTEADVARSLDASRTPAREALRRLAQEGLIVPTSAEPNGKVRHAVAPITAAEANELYLSAGALEGVVAREVALLLLAQRRALAQRLTRAQEQFRLECKRKIPDWDRLFDRHDAFHRTLVDTLAGPKIRTMLDSLRSQLDRYEYFYAPLLGPDFQATFAEHRAIIQAVSAGKADAAERAVRANWFHSAERLTAVIHRVDPARLFRGFGAFVPGVEWRGEPAKSRRRR